MTTIDTTGLTQQQAQILHRIGEFIVPNWQKLDSADMIATTGIDILWDDLMGLDDFQDVAAWLDQRCNVAHGGRNDHPWWPIWFELSELDDLVAAEAKRTAEATA